MSYVQPYKVLVESDTLSTNGQIRWRVDDANGTNVVPAMTAQYGIGISRSVVRDDLIKFLNVQMCKDVTTMPTVVDGSSQQSGQAANYADQEVPSGTINGSNKVFTLAHAPSPAASLLLVLNGIVQQQGSGNDYTLSGTTITYANAPLSGSTHLCWYRF